MSDIVRTMDKLTGYFKKVYPEKGDLKKVVPEVAKLQVDIPFSEKNKLGKTLNFPVMFTLENGFTNGSPSEDVLNYNDTVSATSQEAEVDAYQMALKSLLSFKTASRSLSSEGAFENETKHLVVNMVSSFKKRLEIFMLYGKEGLGVIEAKVDDGSTATLTLTKASFAPVLWAGLENARVDVILANKSNFSHSTARNVLLKAIDIDARKITLDADIEAVLNVGDHIYFAKNSEDSAGTFVSAGAREMPGVKNILTYSGTLFGINNGSYKLWKGSEYSASGGSGTAVLSFEVIQKAVARGVNKGLDGTARVYISTLHWADLINDEMTARRLDGSYSKKKLENGAEAIEFHSQNGIIEIVPHGMVKGGDAFILKLDDWERVGSVEQTFQVPGRGDEIFQPLVDKTAYMIVLYSDQVMFCKRPAVQVYIKDLTYND